MIRTRTEQFLELFSRTLNFLAHWRRENIIVCYCFDRTHNVTYRVWINIFALAARALPLHNYEKLSRIFSCILSVNFFFFQTSILLVFEKIYSCLFIPNCTRNHVITYTNITVISLELLHATYWPFRHCVLKRWIFKALIAVTWIIAGAISSAYIAHRELRVEYFYLWNLFNDFCLTIIPISYAWIYVKVRYGAQGLHHNAATRERKLTTTLFIVTFLSLSLWLLYFVTWVVMEASDNLVTPPFRLIDFFILLVHANSLINPILYLIKISGYRRAFIALFRIRCQQQRRGHVFPINDIWYGNYWVELRLSNSWKIIEKAWRLHRKGRWREHAFNFNRTRLLAHLLGFRAKRGLTWSCEAFYGRAVYISQRSKNSVLQAVISIELRKLVK